MAFRIRRMVVFGLPGPLLILSLFTGPAGSVAASDVLQWLGALLGVAPFSERADLVRAIVWDIRVPRILLTFLVGGSLAVAGATLQAMFRNPLVSPYILGLSSGSAFGAAVAMVTAWLPVYPSAFSCGMFAVGCSYLLGRVGRTVSSVSLVLSGIVVSGIFTALLTIVQFLTDPFKLQTIVHWTMGNLHNADWKRLRDSWAFLTAGFTVLFLLRWRMNVLALGDQEAWAVGVHPEREKVLMLIAATLS
ncbi:MAG: iron ABC transporter permease, partial [Desulfacinum sp.]|nr:iron ABC transporter permease [Desulfacinum sp.]